MKYYFAAELLFTEAAINHIIWPSIYMIKIELDKLAIYAAFNSTWFFTENMLHFS